jgi:hypothetical protein
MSYISSHEKLVDQTIAHFFRRLDELFVETNDVCDLGTWIQYFAWDVIGNLTFSKPLGFLELGDDVENITASIGKFFGINGMVCMHLSALVNLSMILIEIDNANALAGLPFLQESHPL